MPDLLLTLDCLQLQQSLLSSIPESRDLKQGISMLSFISKKSIFKFVDIFSCEHGYGSISMGLVRETQEYLGGVNKIIISGAGALTPKNYTGCVFKDSSTFESSGHGAKRPKSKILSRFRTLSLFCKFVDASSHLDDSPELFASCCAPLKDFLCDELECREAALRRSIPLKITSNCLFVVVEMYAFEIMIHEEKRM